MGLDDESVVDDAAQRARADASRPPLLAAVMLRRGLTPPVLVEGQTSTVVLTRALRAAIRTTLESTRRMQPPSLRGDPNEAVVFHRIHTALSVRSEFVRKADALGMFGLHPL
jgi:hypothetical protein